MMWRPNLALRVTQKAAKEGMDATELVTVMLERELELREHKQAAG